eukprot:Pompholyxophrys_punicea_v1_NODE_242_length_2578_cov_11.424891.p2 type:complete len:136 gc:universal NODE_242_length_2578_cov_11.424891:328-735(+)
MKLKKQVFSVRIVIFASLLGMKWKSGEMGERKFTVKHGNYSSKKMKLLVFFDVTLILFFLFPMFRSQHLPDKRADTHGSFFRICGLSQRSPRQGCVRRGLEVICMNSRIVLALFFLHHTTHVLLDLIRNETWGGK